MDWGSAKCTNPVARHHRRRRRRAYAPTSNTASHDNHEKINSWVSLGAFAFHSTKNSGLNFRNFRMSNETVFSTRADRSRSIPAWAHLPLRITRENAFGSWWSGCLKCSKLLHMEKFNTHSDFNSSLIVKLETYELFSRESKENGRTDPQTQDYPKWYDFIRLVHLYYYCSLSLF